jgi:hypothetical protein
MLAQVKFVFSVDLQIRRYVYHDVVRIEDIQKMVDCTHVQVSLSLCYIARVPLPITLQEIEI